MSEMEYKANEFQRWFIVEIVSIEFVDFSLSEKMKAISALSIGG